jgi:hypothetical protein
VIVLWLDGAEVAHRRQRGVERIGVLGLGKGEIQLGQHLRVAAQVKRLFGHGVAQFAENAANFALFLQLQLAHGVVLLHNLERLDKKCGP